MIALQVPRRPRLATLAVTLILGAPFVLCPPALAGKGETIDSGTYEGDLGIPLDHIGIGGIFDGEIEGRYIDAYEPSEFDFLAIAKDRERSLEIYRAQDYGFVEEPALDAYLNQVLQRVIQAAPVKLISAQVYVRATDTFEASASPDGGIYLTLGLLKDLDDEDELAFVLAHELAHVIYRHHGKDWYAKTQRHSVVASALAYGAFNKIQEVVGKDLGITDELRMAAVVGAFAYEVNASIIDPAWTRDQEEQADLLGFDIIVAAGYNIEGVFLLLEKTGEFERQLEAEKPKRSEEEKQADLEEAMRNRGLGGTFQQMLEELGGAAKEGLDELRKEHIPAPERTETLEAYMGEHYLTDIPPPPTTIAWKTGSADWAATNSLLDRYQAARDSGDALIDGDLAQAETLARKSIEPRTERHAYTRYKFYEVRLKQGKTSLAMRNLEMAMEGQPSYGIFEAAIGLAVAMRNWKLAEDLIESGRGKLDDSPNFLPYRILVYPKVGRDKETFELRVKCFSDYPELADKCTDYSADPEAGQP